MRPNIKIIEVRGDAKNVNLEEPTDETLKQLSSNQEFISKLKTVCDLNHVRFIDVKMSLGGLYHTTSKGMHHYNDHFTIKLTFGTGWILNTNINLVYSHLGVHGHDNEVVIYYNE
ncbi:13702_t:CDS:2 [Entrophospora sp. SA101]|nr:16494_t:CDS:2 [Entrophospora sp. SA101]CAJ0862021.1 18059_t:CDS:2 [Entrophospora sp. SA101]CAJ0865145.1 13702_t:CDS:2 [Entrophospora sp. SA101]CAJ0920822.1 22503_t:CDS:2 [Entrophospora sp. SA101]